jgi:hypothetical protein
MKRTKDWADAFRQAAAAAERRGPGEGIDPKIHQAMIEAYRERADDLAVQGQEHPLA